MRAKLCVRVALALATAGGSSAATAADNEGNGWWYVVPSYHQTGLEKSSTTLKQPGGDIHFDTTFGDDTGPGLAVGYAFAAPYRVDVDYQSHSNDVKNALGP